MSRTGILTTYQIAGAKRISRTEADQRRLRDQRAVVEKLIADQSSRQNYQTAAGKLGTIRAILDAGTFKPDETYELQCLGIVLGDAFVQDLKMEWAEDPQGRDPAVRLPGTSIILFPLTMISKRVERGERVDVFDLYNEVAKVEGVGDKARSPRLARTRTETHVLEIAVDNSLASVTGDTRISQHLPA